MNRIHSAKQDTEHLVDGEPEPLVWLRNSGYPTNEKAKHKVVSEKPGEDDVGYEVHEIETYSLPPEIADAVEDSLRVYVCHCGDFVHRKCPSSFEESTPDEIGACKHIRGVDKSVRASGDDSQTSLGGVSD